ncbi:hypothetical protein [Nocardia brasiliensis]|uniref:hypothetical protein n=1 Tax=Nocardia brasiliensis TaxID=37326 RepID=UPI002454A8A6|nr:hypothetical protein [Nocardia brasiliensis]
MSIENLTPDTDLDDPFIARYAGKVEDPNEVVLRADFARMQHVLDTMELTETGPEFYALGDQANEIDLRWLEGDDAEDRAAWRYLSQAHEDWQQSPEIMAQMYGQMQLDQDRGYQFLTTAQQWRSQQQARELTGHGEWTAERAREDRTPDRTPGLEGSWANAAEIRTSAPVPVSAEFARARTRELAVPKRNAFAGLGGNAFAAAERGGMER